MSAGRMISALIVLLALGDAPSFAAPGASAITSSARYVPRNECARIPGAPAFRTALAGAVARRDVRALTALAAPDIKLDFGGGTGRAELARRLRGPEGPTLWSELSSLLVLGCAVQDGQLVIPSFNSDDLGDADPFEVLLVTGANVPLLARPAATARIKSRLSWQLVKPLLIVDADRPYQQVQVTGSGQMGYLPRNLLRSQIGYRIVAQRSSRTWQIGAFIAGD